MKKEQQKKKIKNSLKDANITLFHLDIFIKIKNKLEGYGIAIEDIDKFSRCVQGIKNYSNYDPFKLMFQKLI